MSQLSFMQKNEEASWVGLEAFGMRHVFEWACPIFQLCIPLGAQYHALWACFMPWLGHGQHGCFHSILCDIIDH